MNSGASCRFHRFPGCVDVCRMSTSQATNDGSLILPLRGDIAHLLRDALDGVEVVWRGGRKSGFDNVHPQA